ncbi:MAG: hypothetical protein M3118_01730 [Actinomycetota bacterium]|nr:hypothetical protein [Actinomycetota bacterium]
MSRTPTKPPTDTSMWRKLIARAHPDTGGDHNLFIWVSELKEYVAGETAEEPQHEPPRGAPNADSDRVPFDPVGVEDFVGLTCRALLMARDVPEKYARLLRLLDDCTEALHGALVREQKRGASYKRLAAIGHRAGMDVRARSGWYRVAESIPLSDRHAGHILGSLKRRAA